MIKIDKNYFLTNDSNQWVLNYEKEGEINTKTDKPTISKDKWYCGTLEQALKRYLNESTKIATSVQELSALVCTAMETIVELTKDIK